MVIIAKKYGFLELAGIALYQAACELAGAKLAPLIRRLGFLGGKLLPGAKGVKAQR